MPRKQQEVIVQVIFSKDGECLKTMIQKSFQAFVDRNLQKRVDFLRQNLQ